VGALSVTEKLTCVTPTSEGFPAKTTSAGTPPTVTVNGLRGFGSCATGVLAAGGAVLTRIVWPMAALALSNAMAEAQAGGRP